MALGLPPGGQREFSFHTWPSFDTGAWASVAGSVQAAHEAAASDVARRPEIVASDRDPSMVAATKANAARAAVDHLMIIEERLVSHLRARSDRGLILTNPPYGKRLGSAKLARLYRRLGAVARDRLPGFDLALLTAHRKLAMQADSGCKAVLSFRHGGLGVKLYHRSGEPGSGEPSARRKHEAIAAGDE